MPQFGGKSAKKSSSDSKRHFKVVIGGKEHGLYVSSTPSSAARKAVTKLCAANKSKKVEFSIREITQGSKKKTYGPYSGYIEKLKEPIELKGRVIKYKPVAKLSGKKGVMKGGAINVDDFKKVNKAPDQPFFYEKEMLGKDKLFFGPIINNEYFTIALTSDGSLDVLDAQFNITHFNSLEELSKNQTYFMFVLRSLQFTDGPKFGDKIKALLTQLRTTRDQIVQSQQQQQQQIMSENKKIILKGFDPSVWGGMNLQHQGKLFNVNIGAVVNPSSYIFVDEKENRPYGTFEDFIRDQNISSAVYREVGYNTKIVIKIGEGGSVAALLSDPNLPELNNISGKLSANTYQQYKSVINKIKANSRIEQEEAERSARLYPN
jgi:hypothetical protein